MSTAKDTKIIRGVAKNWTIDITPKVFRHFLTISYFSSAIRNSPMVWGPPGVGKSTSVFGAAKDITKALNYIFTNLFDFLADIEDGNERAKVAYGVLAAVFNSSYPVVVDKVVKHLITWRCPNTKIEGVEVGKDKRLSDIVKTISQEIKTTSQTQEREKLCGAELSELLTALRELRNNNKPIYDTILNDLDYEYRNSDVLTVARVKEIVNLVMVTISILTGMNGNAKYATMEERMKALEIEYYPLFVVHNNLRLLDYPCLVLAGSSKIEAIKNKQGISERLEPVLKIGGRTARYRYRECIISDVELDEEVAKIVFEAVEPYANYKYQEFIDRVTKSEYGFYFFLFPIVDIRLSQLELDDIKGLPTDVLARVKAFKRIEDYREVVNEEAIKATRTLWLTPPWILEKGIGVVFFDEINQALPHVQGAAYMLMLDRKVTTGSTIGDNIMVVAAGNQPSFAPEVARELATPLLDRLKPQYNMMPKVNLRDYNPYSPIIGTNSTIYNTISVLYDLVNETYGHERVEDFVEYLNERGIKVRVDDFITKAFESATRVSLISEEERATIPLTPRGIEFIVRSLGPRERFWLITELYDSYARHAKFMSPLLYVLYTYFGHMGVSSIERHVSILKEFLVSYIGVISGSIFARYMVRDNVEKLKTVGWFERVSELLGEEIPLYEFPSVADDFIAERKIKIDGQIEKTVNENFLDNLQRLGYKFNKNKPKEMCEKKESLSREQVGDESLNKIATKYSILTRRLINIYCSVVTGTFSVELSEEESKDEDYAELLRIHEQREKIKSQRKASKKK